MTDAEEKLCNVRVAQIATDFDNFFFTKLLMCMSNKRRYQKSLCKLKKKAI